MATYQIARYIRPIEDVAADLVAKARIPTHPWPSVVLAEDAERIFAYRALCVARGDSRPLPGFDENDYMRGAAFHERSLAELRELDAGFLSPPAMDRMALVTRCVVAEIPVEDQGNRVNVATHRCQLNARVDGRPVAEIPGDGVALGECVAVAGGAASRPDGRPRHAAVLLGRVWPEATIALFRDVKHAFDPRQILNPGVKVPLAGQRAIEDVKYDPRLAPLPAVARAAIDRLVLPAGPTSVTFTGSYTGIVRGGEWSNVVDARLKGSLATLAMGALPVARWGSADQQAKYLPALQKLGNDLARAIVRAARDRTPRPGRWHAPRHRFARRGGLASPRRSAC